MLVGLLPPDFGLEPGLEPAEAVLVVAFDVPLDVLVILPALPGLPEFPPLPLFISNFLGCKDKMEI